MLRSEITYPEMARLSLIVYFYPINIFVLCISGYEHTFPLTALDNSIKNTIDMLLLITLGLRTNKIFIYCRKRTLTQLNAKVSYKIKMLN